MSETILVAIITGGLSLVGVVFSNMSSNKRIENALTTQQAVTDTKLEELTREVRAHNNFAQRVPVLEEQMKVANHRIEDLESFVTIAMILLLFVIVIANLFGAVLSETILVLVTNLVTAVFTYYFSKGKTDKTEVDKEE